MTTRQYTPVDHLLINLQQAVTTVFGTPAQRRANPGDDTEDAELSHGERSVAAGCMRVNHAGEVCAQALYQGQAMTARLDEVRGAMEQAAEEENDHLAWCQQRLSELGSHTSYLNPLWYGGSFLIGAAAGAVGDKWSLGFVAETERQVVRHLDGHLQRLPQHDQKSRAILEQMKIDEAKHATTALEAGGAELPPPVKRLMRLTSKVMTSIAFRI
jgi:ubiquinone biosynthesis monooxygenase Coq7